MELKRYWLIIKKRWKLVLAIISGIFLLSVIGVFVFSPVYNCSATVMLVSKDIEPAFVSSLPSDMGKIYCLESKNAIDTYIALLQDSHSIASVIQELNLRDRYDGDFLQPKKMLATILNLPRILLYQKYGVKISQVSSAEMIDITGYGPTPQEAARVANVTKDTFLALYYKLNHKQASDARHILEQELRETKDKLDEVELSLQKFKQEQQIADMSQQADNLINNISTLMTSQAGVKRTLADKKAGLLSTESAIKHHPEYLISGKKQYANPNLQDFKDKLIDLEIEKAKLKAEQTSEHPKLTSITNAIERIKDQIRQEVISTFGSEEVSRSSLYDSLVSLYANAEIDIAGLQAQDSVYSRQLTQLYKDLYKLPSQQTKIGQFNRDILVLTSSYNLLRTQLESAKIAEQMDVANALEIHPAVPSLVAKQDKYFPRKGVVSAYSLLVACCMAVFMAFMLEYLDDSISCQEEVIQLTGKTALATIPFIPKPTKSTQELLNCPPVLDACWELMSGIQQTAKEQISRLLVVSPTEGGGSSSISCGLALSAAESGRKTLLLDANLYHPDLHNFCNVGITRGLSDYLNGKSNLSEIIRPTKISNLDLIPAGSVTATPARLMTDREKLQDIFRELAARYETIICDVSHINKTHQVLALSEHFPHLLLVLCAGITTPQQVTLALHQLQNAGISILGSVLNQFK